MAPDVADSSMYPDCYHLVQPVLMGPMAVEAGLELSPDSRVVPRFGMFRNKL